MPEGYFLKIYILPRKHFFDIVQYVFTDSTTVDRRRFSPYKNADFSSEPVRTYSGILSDCLAHKKREKTPDSDSSLAWRTAPEQGGSTYFTLTIRAFPKNERTCLCLQKHASITITKAG